MRKRHWFFGEVLDEANFNGQFDNVEQDGRSRALDGMSPGIVVGANLTAYAGDNNSFLVAPGVVIGPSGERIVIRNDGNLADTGGFLTIDIDGASTSPGAGNYRWLTIVVRFGRTLATAETDDLSNTVFTDLQDSWNLNGTANANDISQSANQAVGAHGTSVDGGYAVDHGGLSLDAFAIIAGPTALIGDPLTYPTIPDDAIILADVLYTDGDEGTVLLSSAISYARTQVSYATSPSGLGFPADSGSPFPRLLLWEIENANYKTRFYRSQYGLEITVNARWDAEAVWWVPDLNTFQATRFTQGPGGFIFELRYDTSAGHWQDLYTSVAGWDSFQSLAPAATHGVSFADFSGNMRGNGVQSGYVSLAAGSGSPITTAVTSIQFPRKFTSTPSSVTLSGAGSAGTELNVSSVSTTNLRTEGCDFVVNMTGTGAFTARRVYTATQ